MKRPMGIVRHATRQASAPGVGQAIVEMDHAGVDVDVSAETSRRVACDSSSVIIHHGADGAVLDAGRQRRTIPAAIRRALSARDTHCRFPGCTSGRCDAHHIRHWADGGRGAHNGHPVRMRSFLAVYRADLVIDAASLVETRINLPAAKYGTPEQRIAFHDRLQERMSAIPGIESVAIATASPYGGTGLRQLSIDGRPQSPLGDVTRRMSPLQFATKSAPLTTTWHRHA